MTNHIIRNDALRAVVSDSGAELISVQDLRTGRERIWTADPAVWNRHSPILFPFVGKVTGGKYRLGDREYDMPTQHGFARDLPFACVSETPSSVTHVLTADEATRKNYPFDFRLSVTHSLCENRIQVTYGVENRSGETMYFCIGGHPGFLLPEGVRKEDCFLVFPECSTLRYIGADGTGFGLPDSVYTLHTDGGYAPWQDDIPDTWIFEDHQVKTVGIALPDRKPFVMMTCEQFPMLAIWANPKGTFLCLEPWVGRTDDAGFRGTVDQKKSIASLRAGEQTEFSYTIQFD